MRYQAALITDWTEQDSSKSAAQMHAVIDRSEGKDPGTGPWALHSLHQITIAKHVPPP